MRTLKTILLTVVTMVVLATGMLFKMGNLKIEKVETQHNAVVVIDGVEMTSASWNELFGYNLKIDLVDGRYIGR